LKEWGEHMAKRLKNESETATGDTIHVWMADIWSALSQKRSMREADALYYSTHMWSVTAMNDYIRRLGHDLYAWNLKSSTSGTTARTEVINPGMDRAWGFYERPAKSFTVVTVMWTLKSDRKSALQNATWDGKELTEQANIKYHQLFFLHG
jgi:hypothetical protein